MTGRRSFLGAVATAALSTQPLGLRAQPGAPAPMDDPTPIVELRQYTLRGGRRAEFKQLFGSSFVTPQEDQGIRIAGWFDDLDDPDRFVWVRGYATMAQRASGLEAFYGGEVWKSRRALANSMIVDSDNVLLLRPVDGAGGISTARIRTTPLLTVAIHYLPSADVPPFDAFFRSRMVGGIEAAGGELLGRLGTHPGPNNFPRLPVRANESVFVWFAGFPTAERQAAFTRQASAASGWRDDAPEPLLSALMRKPEVLHLRA